MKYKTLSKLNDPNEIHELGEFYWEGKEGFEQSYEKAVECYTKSADKGNIESIYRLGYCYANSLGVEQNQEIADKLLSYAVDNGHVEAAAKLGAYLYWGDYLPLDKARGFQYLKYAADHGNAHSMALVGEDYLNGSGAYEGWGPTKDLSIGKEI